MSEEESEHNEGSQSEEADDQTSEVSPAAKTSNSGGPSPVVKKSKSNENNKPLNLAKNVDKTTIMKTKTLQETISASEKDSNSSETSSCVSQQPTGVSSGAPGGGPVANMTFDGGALSDEEANSWEDDVSDTDGSDREYYDEEDDDDEISPSPQKGDKDNQMEAEADEDDEDDGNGRLCMNLYCTEYDIIRKVARKVHNFKIREYHEDHDGAVRRGQHNQKLVKEWDVSWHDLSITPDYLAKLNLWQKINHYPGMYAITRKNHLARNLMRMKRAFPEEFNFFPATWVLPGDNIDFRNQFGKSNEANTKEKRQTYIVKPDGLSQGKGIFLSRRMETILNGIETAKDEEGIGGWVVQHYLDQPHLVDDLKYDLRIYVLLNCVNPLRVYIHEEGLARFCTEPYRKPTARNMNNLFMHLTNYAINKNSDAYQQGEESSGDEESGHKRSLKAIMQILACCGADADKLMREIKDIVVKTMATSQPYLNHLYRSCQPEDIDGSMCFQILGFDIMIDKRFKPWLIEVNQSPSFATDSPLDYKTKKAVLQDTFSMLNCSVSKRKKILKEQQAQMTNRILTGKQHKIDPEVRAKLRAEKLKERFEWEEKRKGQWELIYPWPDEERNVTYGHFIKRAQEIWDEFTTGKGKRISMEDKRQNNNPSLNRQATTKNAQNHRPGISNTGSMSNLRSGTQQKNIMRSGMGNSTRDLNHSVLRDQHQNSMPGKSQFNIMANPPRTSAGEAYKDATAAQAISHQHALMISKNCNSLTSGSLLNHEQTTPVHKSIYQLEIIEQKSQEGSPLLPGNLRTMMTETSNLELLPDTRQQQQQYNLPSQFKIQLQPQQYNNARQSHSHIAKDRNVEPTMADHLKMLAQPTQANKSPLTNIIQQKEQLELQTNQIIQQIDASRGLKAIPQHQLKLGSLSQPKHIETSVVLNSTDSKQSFMQRHMDAHRPAQIASNNLHLTNNRLKYSTHRDTSPTNIDRNKNASHLSQTQENMTPGRARNKEKDFQKRQDQKEIEAFGASKKTNIVPSRLTRKVGEHACIPSEKGSATRRRSGDVSSEGRSSLQMAGSEQMNFLIATNYSAAKINIEQFKQQASNHLAVKENSTPGAYDHRTHFQHVHNKERPSQVYASTWQGPAQGSETPQKHQQNTSHTLQHAKLIQNKQHEMTQKALLNRQQIDSEGNVYITPQAYQNLKSEKVQQALALTEKKKAGEPGIFGPMSSQDGDMNSRTIISSVKTSNQIMYESQDLQDAAYDQRLNNKSGVSNGFPQVNYLHVTNDVAPRSIKVPQKQAIKMTQMPIFIAEAQQSSHRTVVRKRETPKQKFKKLPGISSEPTQSELLNKPQFQKASKTVVKGSTTKLDTMMTISKERRFEPTSAQQVKGLKNVPTYSMMAGTEQTEDNQYFNRRHAQQQQQVNNVGDKSGGPHPSSGKQPGRVIPSGLPVSHLPLKQGPNMQQLTGVVQNGETAGQKQMQQPHQHQQKPQRRAVNVVQGSSDWVREQQQTTSFTSTSAGNQNNNQGGLAMASQLTPFQLYQQQQMQLQLQQKKSTHAHKPSPQYPMKQQQSGVVGGQGGVVGGGSTQQHQQQQNQFLLQSNNNQRPQQQQQQKFQPLLSNTQQNNNTHSQLNNKSTTHQQNQMTTAASSLLNSQKSSALHVHKHQANNESQAAQYGHQSQQQRVLSQIPVRTSSSKVNTNGAGSSANKNRRLNRALGQGKSVGIGSSYANQKSRGQINANVMSFGVIGGQKKPERFFGVVSGQPSGEVAEANRTQNAWDNHKNENGNRLLFQSKDGGISSGGGPVTTSHNQINNGRQPTDSSIIQSTDGPSQQETWVPSRPQRKSQVRGSNNNQPMGRKGV